MHAPKRRFEPAVIERLFQAPYRFEYFQAVRLLELWLKRHGTPQHGLVANFLRFQNSTSLGFPASQIEAIDTEPRDFRRDAASHGSSLQSATLKYVRMTPSFMGLLGSTGSLPAHYTERIAAHLLYQKDEGPRAFLDTYSNRSLALFYEAWRKYRLELKYQLDGHDTFLSLLLALAGLGSGSLRKRLADEMGGFVLDESIGYFSASMRQRPASAIQIARMLSEYFGQPVRAEQFIGCWYDVPAGQQTTLGGANSALGAGAMVGARVWQRDLRLRLLVGPLDGASFNAFLPGGMAARALRSMVNMFTGVSLEYEVELVLLAAEVRGVSLTEEPRGRRLGWDTYMVAGPQADDRRDVRYQICAL
ncbi:type VI secretion system baseplate subunit TssG [Massilia sp. RP-1-19]|uniref:Type VI secretion system baseplate subunit TssG n=1 Tax=Massilia polaris TaxID=2728846 RepID=A0A848HI75_9BURK|nr:type VI secretion system baseplate subunit TssG [Massilia polaris]NML60757.1 type VI secretion system baseplate subunit TssG [Massilia polaris]